MLKHQHQSVSNANLISYLTILGQEEKEEHLLDFYLTYAQAHKPPAKRKTSFKQKANSGAESIVIKNKKGRKKLPTDENGEISRN